MACIVRGVGAVLSFLLYISSVQGTHGALLTTCDQNRLREALTGGGVVQVVCDGLITLDEPLIICLGSVLHNTILADNHGPNGNSLIEDGGHNISSDDSIDLNSAGSLINTDPLLGTYGDHGGLTPTFALAIQLMDDNEADGTKSIELSLSGPPGGAALGTPATAVLDLLDDETPRIVSTCDETELRQALSLPGRVLLRCDGEIVITRTIVISNRVDLDASDHTVTLSGKSVARLLGRITGYLSPAGASVSLAETITPITPTGHFGFCGLSPGTYSVQPASADSIFTQTSRLVSVGPDRVDVHFHSYRSNSWTYVGIIDTQSHWIFASEPGRAFRVLRSSDCADWTEDSQHSLPSNGLFEFTAPAIPGSHSTKPFAREEIRTEAQRLPNPLPSFPCQKQSLTRRGRRESPAQGPPRARGSAPGRQGHSAYGQSTFGNRKDRKSQILASLRLGSPPVLVLVSVHAA